MDSFEVVQNKILEVYDNEIVKAYAEIEVSERQEIPTEVTRALYFTFAALSKASVAKCRKENYSDYLDTASTTSEIAVIRGYEYLLDANIKRIRKLYKLYGKLYLRKVNTPAPNFLVNLNQEVRSLKRDIRRARDHTAFTDNPNGKLYQKACSLYKDAVEKSQAIIAMFQNNKEDILNELSNRNHRVVLNTLASILGLIGIIIGIHALMIP